MSQVSDLQEEVAALEQWRALALQFDHHRMRALSMLKTLVADPSVENAVRAQAFLAEPPVPHHEIVAKLEECQNVLRLIPRRATTLDREIDAALQPGTPGVWRTPMYINIPACTNKIDMDQN